MAFDPTPFGARLALVLAAAAVFIIFGVAGAHFFRRPLHTTRRRFWTHQVGSGAVGSAHLAGAAVAPLAGDGAVAAAIALFAGALALFLWTQEATKREPPYLAFSGVHPDRPIVDGPYRFVRHPFYLSFTLALFAVPVATWNSWLLASAFALTVNYVAAAFEEEAGLARTAGAERYRAYAQRTGMFLPRPTVRSPRVLGHDLSVLAIIAIVAAMGLAVTMLWELLMP